METVWKITLFGGLRAIPNGGGEAIARFRTRKAAALLACLAFRISETTPPTRDELIETLWPYSDPVAALARLAVELSSLRRQLEPPGTARGAVLRADRFSLSLNPAAVTTDVAEFEALLRRVRLSEPGDTRIAFLTGTIRAYGGPLLPQMDSDWIEPERERLAAQFVDSATEAISTLMQIGAVNDAVEIARLARQRERLREPAHVLVMRSEVASGRPADALRSFEELQRMLRETGSEPGAEARFWGAEARKLREDVGSTSQHAVDVSEDGRRSSPHGSAAVSSAQPLPLGTIAMLATDI